MQHSQSTAFEKMNTSKIVVHTLMLLAGAFFGAGISGCSQSSTPDSQSMNVMIDPQNVPIKGATIIFNDVEQYITTDTTTNTHTIRLTADSLHRTIGTRHNVTWWNDDGFGNTTCWANYTGTTLEIQNANSWDRSTTFDLSASATGFKEVFRIDSVITDSVNVSVQLNDSVRSFGIEVLKLATLTVPTIHLQEKMLTEYLSRGIPYSLSVASTDFWYAPSIGFFVMEDRYLPRSNQHGHLEMIAYYTP
jgi:hypothetical protein